MFILTFSYLFLSSAVIDMFVFTIISDYALTIFFKAISVTIVTFITEPMKHVGEGISDFIRALLKDLLFTLHFPVFILVYTC